MQRVTVNSKNEGTATVLSRELTKGDNTVFFIISSGIFGVLFVAAYLMFSVMSIAVMAIGGITLFYYLFKVRSRTTFSVKNKRRKPSLLFFLLLITPLLFSISIFYEGFSLGMSILRVVIVWGFTINFWAVMLFVPMAIYNRQKEKDSKLSVLPFVSVIVPAYNEEKVIENTIKSLMGLSYSNKEIIIVDDGSKDQTLQIARRFQNSIVVLHKENGGKSSALNFGVEHAKGEIVVIVDADTILEKNSLVSLVNGFATNKNLGAVGGNIKIRNRMNLLTWCQSMEYIAGINIVRRAFDIFGTINMLPGALAAFKKSELIKINGFNDDTLVEDFDATIRLIKNGVTVQANNQAIAYTEAPQTLGEFCKQRKRWYRGNLQVFVKHIDVLLNPKYSALYNLVFPFMLLSMLVLPLIGMIIIGASIFAILSGDGLFVLAIFTLFIILQHLQTALSVRLDGENPKVIAYSFFAVIGYKQIMDFLLIKACLEELLKRKAVWTNVKRVGE